MTNILLAQTDNKKLSAKADNKAFNESCGSSMKKEELGFLFYKYTAVSGRTAVEREDNHPTRNHFFSSYSTQ